MTIDHATPATLLVAIDISKHRHEVLIGIPRKKRRRRMTVTNKLEDFKRLSAALTRGRLRDGPKSQSKPLAADALPTHQSAGFNARLNASVAMAINRL